MKKVLVIGYGSIGKRHYNVFNELKAEVAVLSKQKLNFENTFKDLKTALSTFNPEIVVVANKTSDHINSVKELMDLKFNGVALVEKPLFEKVYDIKPDFKIVITYNLRFHPVLSRLKTELSDKRIIHASVYCGQYLPKWRPGSDYRECYSAKKAEGGGALRDLSHELDYCNWLFGDLERYSSIVGKFSSLDIDSDDLTTIMGSTFKCPSLTMTVNYIDRVTKRNIRVICDECTYEVDLVTGSLFMDNELLITSENTSYYSQAQKALENDLENFCNFTEGQNIVSKLIEIEKVKI